MSTIHDRNKKKSEVSIEESLAERNLGIELEEDSLPSHMPQTEVEQISQQNLSEQKHTEVKDYQERASNALSLVNDVVLKNYLVQLSGMDLVEMPDVSTDGIILFKINKMVYEKDEYATDKFVSMVSAMTFTSSSIFILVDGHKDHTDFYLGIRCEDENRTASSVAETFKSAIC